MTYQPTENHEADGFPHQLDPLKGGRYTSVFHGPPGTDVGDLHCDLEPFMMEDGPVTINHSGWMPTMEHVAQLESGAHIRLTVWQHPIPPLAVSVEPPVCSCHDEPMQWDPEDRGYYCRFMQIVEQELVEKSELQKAKEQFTPGPEE